MGTIASESVFLTSLGCFLTIAMPIIERIISMQNFLHSKDLTGEGIVFKLERLIIAIMMPFILTIIILVYK